MRTLSWKISLLVLVVTVSGCAVPRINLITPDPENPNKIKRDEVMMIINRTLCEISASPDLQFLRDHKYVASVQLLLKAETTDGLTPSLSFIHPFAIPMTSITKVIGGELSQSNLHSFNQSYLVDIVQIPVPTADDVEDCKRGRNSLQLNGALGMQEIIAAGLHDVGPEHKMVHWTDDKGRLLATPSFGSTVQFIFKKSANGGPALVQTHFKGPGGMNGLLAASRTTTDQLIVGFAPSPQSIKVSVVASPPKPTPAPSPLPSKNLVDDGTASTTGVPDLAGRSRFDAFFKGDLLKQLAPVARVLPNKAAPPPPSVDDDSRLERAAESAKSVVDTQIIQNLNLQPR